MTVIYIFSGLFVLVVGIAAEDVASKDVASKDVASKDVASEFKAAKIEPDIIDKVPNETIEVIAKNL